mgnify:CR=1 FL=1
MAPDTIAAMPTFDDDEAATPSAGLGIGGLDMSGMNNGMSLAGNGGDYTPAGGSALAGGLTAAELEAHLAATLGGLHTGGIEAPEHSAQEQKASSSVEQSHADSAAAPSAWGASPPPGMGGMQQRQLLPTSRLRFALRSAMLAAWRRSSPSSVLRAAPPRST